MNETASCEISPIADRQLEGEGKPNLMKPAFRDLSAATAIQSSLWTSSSPFAAVRWPSNTLNCDA